MNTQDITQHIWDTRYRHRDGAIPREDSITETWQRVATALAAVEPVDRTHWTKRFHAIMQDFQFLPGGRIQAGAGTGHDVTLFNCFVMGVIEDSISGIFRALEEGAVTMQQGGGIGYDFSTLRPCGACARGSNTIAAGPVSFMQIWDAMCATMLSTGARRGAMMASLRCDHPDIFRFIAVKRDSGQLRHFNLSVQITDEFMQAVRTGADWPLLFPAESFDGDGETVLRTWPGCDGLAACRVLTRVAARGLWDELLRASYSHGEPGVLFIDRINRLNNLGYREYITVTNPCGEIPLPPYGACDLGSINLTRLIRDPFTPRARLDHDRLMEIVPIAVRMLDNVINLSHFPLPQQRAAALRSRRIGLGLTGLADALIMLGLRYGEPASVAFAEEVMRLICHGAYRASAALAEEKGPFPELDRDCYLAAPFIAALPVDIRDTIAQHGIRNSHLIALAPAGTISLLAGNISSGIEPVFASMQRRSVINAAGRPIMFDLVDYAVQLWRDLPHPSDSLPPAFIAAADVPIAAHLAFPAALQPHVDHAISKTINLPEACDFSSFASVYGQANALGLKGCTVFRANPARGAVLCPVAPHQPREE